MRQPEKQPGNINGEPMEKDTGRVEVSEERLFEAQDCGMSIAPWAEEIPDTPAIISDAGNRTFAELNANANRLARALRARGLGEDDSIALVCSNRPEFAEVLFATQRAGMRLTPVNWHLVEEEAGWIINNCEARAVVADARFARMAAGAVRQSSRISVRLAVGGDIEGFEPFDQALDDQSADNLEDPVLGYRMLYTSGTTGRPKGVVRPKSYQFYRTETTSQAAGYLAGTGQLHLCTGPLYHAAPLAFSIVMPLIKGIGTVLMGKWDAEETLRLIEQYRITHTHMVPTMFHRLLALPQQVKERYDISSLRFLVHGADICPVATKNRIIEWFGPVVWEYYSATEGSVGAVGPEQWLAKPGTVGKPDEESGVIIVGDDGEQLPSGKSGTVYIRMKPEAGFCYYKDEEKTAAATRGQHFTLGDVGYLDEEGFLFLTDRSANLIISGGVNIYPAEVEAVLIRHDAVRDAAVIGIPDQQWGEEVKAVVELRQPAQASAELAASLIEFCRERLAHYKCPRSVDFIESLPRQDNGKLYKRQLREQYRSAPDR